MKVMIDITPEEIKELFCDLDTEEEIEDGKDNNCNVCCKPYNTMADITPEEFIKRLLCALKGSKK